MLKRLIPLLTLSVLLSACQTTQELIAEKRQQDPSLAQIAPQSVVEEQSSRYFALVGVDGKPVKSNLVKAGPHIVYVYGLIENNQNSHGKTNLYSAKHALKVRLEPGQNYNLITELDNEMARVWLVHSQTGQIASSLSQEALTLEQSPQIERIKIKGERVNSQLKGYVTERNFRMFFRKSVAAPEGSEAGNKAPERCFYTAVCMG